MKKINLFTYLIVLSTVYCSAQIENNGIINATGGQKVIAGNTFEYSIGEMTLTHTVSASSLVVTQGLLQPQSGSAGIHTPELLDKDLQVYPNPTSTILYIKPNLKSSSSLEMILYDVAGRKVLQTTAQLNTGDEIQHIDCSPFAAGNYILVLITKNAHTEYRNHFKIIKTN